MSVKLYNQLTKNVDEFRSIQPGKATIYTCGPTVYSYPTVGNWTAYVYWDTLVRILNANNFEVHRVMNITDVGHLVGDADEGEDKLEKGARQEGKTAWEVAEFYTEDFTRGMQLLNMVTPTSLPKATDYIAEQLELVRVLKEKGYTYQINDGIYYDTSKFPTYNDFANLDLEAQKAGARVEYNIEKRNPSDFALWKFTPPGEARDMEWETPSELLETLDDPQGDGPVKIMGFPGWHLECSAMVRALLGDTIDIHTGGIDHIPVHHTNEIAQSQAATGKELAHYWLHNNHLKVDGTKISKSLGNGYTLQDIIEKGYDPLDLRMFILQSHYRSEGNFTFENLAAARNRRLNWRNVAALRHQIHHTLTPVKDVEADSKTIDLYAASGALLETLSDDINTSEAMANIDEAFNRITTQKPSTIHQHALNSFLGVADELLGLKLLDTSPDVSDDVKMLIIERSRARDNQDYQKSDKIRDELLKSGVSVRDTAFGPIWEYVS